MRLPRNIRKALNSKINDMTSWVNLLNFFSKHENELTQRQKKCIYHKCEKMRKYWNKERISTEQITCPSGEIINVEIINSPLNIRKIDIKPDNLYKTIITDNLFKIFLQKAYYTFMVVFCRGKELVLRLDSTESIN